MLQILSRGKYPKRVQPIVLRIPKASDETQVLSVLYASFWNVVTSDYQKCGQKFVNIHDEFNDCNCMYNLETKSRLAGKVKYQHVM